MKPINRHAGMHDFAGKLELATSVVFRHPGLDVMLSVPVARLPQLVAGCSSKQP
jgi:hypothetical protein